MRKLLLLLSSVSFSLSASLYVPEKLGSLALFNSPVGFAVLKDKKIHHLGPEAVDATLRKMDFKQRNMYMMKCGLVLNQTTGGEYILRAAPKLKGGGVWGARIGAFLGKAIVSIVGHGMIIIVSAVVSKKSEKGGVAVGIGLESTWGAWIEALSMKGAMVGGIIGGVATGPV